MGIAEEDTSPLGQPCVGCREGGEQAEWAAARGARVGHAR